MRGSFVLSDTSTRTEIEAVTDRWEAALARRDLDALVGTYAPDATLESPLVPHIPVQNQVYWGWRGVKLILDDASHR
jgi:ketosteroid isomerase-like protein